jgi:glycine cleavage system H protein
LLVRHGPYSAKAHVVVGILVLLRDGKSDEEMRYTAEHVWARVVDTRVRVGITDFAQKALGDIVFVDLPATGSTVEAGGVIGEVESTKSTSDVYAPVGGTVAAVNETLSTAPEQINADPYGDGWLCEIAPTGPGAIDSLLDAAAYQAQLPAET